MKNFVHLHLHSQYSLLDGTIQFAPLVAKVREMGMPAVAVTDHGGMMGTVEFYEEANRGGVRPILGAEVYVAPGRREERRIAPTGEYAYHLILLAENETGYRNLIQLASRAYLEGSLSYSWQGHESRRNVLVDGLSREARSDHDADIFGAQLGAQIQPRSQGHTRATSLLPE